MEIPLNPPLPKGDAEKSSKQMLTIPHFLIGSPEGAPSSGRSPGRVADSNMVQSENIPLTFYAPSPFPSPQRGVGGGEGKISNIFG